MRRDPILAGTLLRAIVSMMMTCGKIAVPAVLYDEPHGLAKPGSPFHGG
jgi:hypothetical protein